MAKVTGERWHIEECFKVAKNHLGLGEMVCVATEASTEASMDGQWHHDRRRAHHIANLQL